jgi:fatty acid desaturase
MARKREARRNSDRLIFREAVARGHFVDQTDTARYPIPGRLNATLALTQVLVCLALLAAASRANSPWVIGLSAVLFAFMMQLGFGLAHEAAHNKLYPNSGVNEALGILLFSLFPGSYHLFSVAHLVHHRRNRSDAELEDYILPTETSWMKRVTYYLVLCGLFWLLTPLATLAMALVPGRSIGLPAPDVDASVSTRYLQFLNSVRPGRIRRDLFLLALTWTSASLLLHFKLSHLAICYATFAFCWASQQYIYHVRTPRHVVLGAVDLHLWRPFELLYVHFNYHLTHHVAAWVPWIYLPEVAAERPTRGYLTTYLEQWRPPEPVEKAWPPRFQESGPLPALVSEHAPAARGTTR